jgi:L-threonylcarbamoyladenylate synthase
VQTQVIDIRTDKKYALEEAKRLILGGEVVAVPTETVYGLAANAFDEIAVGKIFEAKGRPQDNPLIVHISEIGQLDDLVEEIPEAVKKLAEEYWPGPLTMIMKKSEKIPGAVSAGLDTVAVRMPKSEYAREIISECSVPLAAPSANLSGSPSPTKASYVLEDMNGRIPLIIDGGECEIGVESTVISFVGEKPRLLRPGGITLEMLESVIGEVELDNAVLNKLGENEKAHSPGMKYKHYAPKADITVVKGSLGEFLEYVRDKGEFFALCFDGEEKYFENALSYGKENDGSSQAKRLFDALRELDENGAKTVYARCPDIKGLGLAVYNRLIRSAGFKIVEGRKMTVIGLTGQTGAGKSTVAKMLTEYGCIHIDADALAKTVIQSSEAVLNSLKNEFGADIFKNGVLDRKSLAKKAFSSIKNTQKLNELTHPAVTKAIEKIIESQKEKGAKAVIIDAIALIESGEDKMCDFTVAVVAPRDVRFERIVKRDNLTERQANERIDAQKDESFYTDNCDYTVRNYGEYKLEKELEPIIARLS